MGFLQRKTICSFSESSCGIGLVFSVILDREGIKQKKDKRGGDYSRAAIISNILAKRWRLIEI